MNRRIVRSIGMIVMLLSVSLACNLGSQLDQARQTAQSVATEVQQGRDFLATSRAIATVVGGSGLIQTAQALATEVGDTGLLETAQAYATEQGPALLATAQALATQQGPGLRETAQALATRAALTLGDKPDDIPVVEGERQNYIASSQLVSYFTPLEFQQVVDFYRAQMPVNGWSPIEQGAVLTENTATLNYVKGERLVSITLTVNPLDNHTIVVITLQGQ
ncbi:MAG TPA: hypothetical protein VJL34_00700 [Anaerolineales bacterium]|nr:hypothetical protein [Anaerolineales bacterium]